jgi:hypothetical protein
MMVMRGIAGSWPVLVHRFLEAGLYARHAPASTGHHERKRRDDHNELVKAANHNVEKPS